MVCIQIIITHDNEWDDFSDNIIKLEVRLKAMISYVLIIFLIIFGIIEIILKRFINYKKNGKKTKKILLILRVGLIILLFAVLLIIGNGRLPIGMSNHSFINIVDSGMTVKYKEANRSYYRTYFLTTEQKNNVYVISSCLEGIVYLKIKQGTYEENLDISNYDSILDLSKFDEGYISFTITNENAKNVSVQIEIR